MRFGAQTCPLWRSGRIESQKRGPANVLFLLRHRSRRPRGWGILWLRARRRALGKRRGRGSYGRPRRRALRRWSSDGRRRREQRSAAHSAKAVSLQVLIAAASAAHLSSSSPSSLYSLRYLGGSMQNEHVRSTGKMTRKPAEKTGRTTNSLQPSEAPTRGDRVSCRDSFPLPSSEGA